MADQAQQQEPMVRVKKADGSFEMVPLSQVGKKAQAVAAPAEASMKMPRVVGNVSKKRKRKKKLKESTERGSAFVPPPSPKQRKEAHIQKPTFTPPPSPRQRKEKQVAMAAVTSHELATTTPVADAFVDMAAAKVKDEKQAKQEPLVANGASPSVQSVPMPPSPESTSVVSPERQNAVQWSKEDHASPLEEPGHEVYGDHQAVSPATQQEVDRIFSALPKAMREDWGEKLRQLILARVKDVKTDDQLHQQLSRAAVDGGFGMNPGDAAQVIATIAMEHDKDLPQAIVAKSPVEQVEPTTVAPAGVSHGSEQVPEREPKKDMPKIPLQTRDIPYEFPSAAKTIRQSAMGKSAVQDVLPPRPSAGRSTQGPVDIAKNMTLRELRLRSSDPKVAFEDVRDEIHDLKKESYLQYEKAVAAWRCSPIMRNFQNVVMQALNNRMTIAEVLAQSGQEKTFTEEEFMEFVAINKTF